MEHAAPKQLYRIDLSDRSCRSVDALAMLNVLDLRGVEAATFGTDALLVVASGEYDMFEEILRAAVASGLDPRTVVAGDIDRIFDPSPLSADEAERLGLIEAPKEPVRATVETVQRIQVQVTDGYDPETIIIQAGMPAEITFSEGHGCLGKVVFDALGLEADLEHGGATIKIPALAAGTYPFRCGMDMVHGTLIAE